MSDTPAPTSYFDRAYRDYKAQNSPRKTDHYLDQIEALVAPGRHDLLDIGCGLGSFLRRATERFPNWSLYGSDIELSAVEATQQLVSAATIVRASATESPFPAGSFDVVTAWDVIEHVPDRDAVAASVSQMLRPGGLLRLHDLVYDFAPEETETVLESWLSGVPEDPEVAYTRAELAEHIRTEHSTFRWLFEPMLTAAGFEITESAFRAKVFASYTCVRR